MNEIDDKEKREVFDIVFDWVLMEAAQNGGDSAKVMDICQKTMDSLKDVATDADLDEDLELIENILPDVVKSVVEHN
jgi:hypothetical protein